MPSTQSTLQWMNLDDFRPGIKGRVTPADIARSTTKILGVADKSGTYRCHALADGSLAPMPKRTYSLVVALTTSSTLMTQARVTIAGFHVCGPIIGQVGRDSVEFHILYIGVKAADSKGTFYWKRIRHNDADQVDTLFSANPTGAVTFPATRLPNGTFHSWRADSSDPTIAGVPCVVMAWGEGLLSSSNYWKTFPSPSTPGSDTPGTLAAISNTRPLLATAHQGRALVLLEHYYSHGATAFNWQDCEQLVFTDANTIVVANETSPQVFGMENATGYSAILSTSHSEFLMLKNVGGGMFVRGDLADPTVLRLPSLPGLGRRGQEITSSPVGVVFRTDSGVWLWNGGEGAENIGYDAVNSSDIFPVTNGTDVDFDFFVGRSCYWHDWVLLPKNWAWDWREKSWWIIDDQSDVSMFWWGPPSVNGANILYCTPAHVVDSAPSIYGYDYNTPASDYKWTSLPLPLPVDRDSKIREVVLVATGVGTVKLDYTDLTGAVESHTFTLSSSTSPVHLRANTNVDCTELRLVITATSTGVTPVVHEIRHLVEGRTTLPNANV